MPTIKVTLSSFTSNNLKPNKLIFFQTKRVFRKFLFLIPNLIGIFFSPLFVLLIRVIRPIILVRYALILTTRIGHFTENLDLYLSFKEYNLHNSDLKNYKKKIINIFYCQEDISNKFFFKMLKKKIIILPRFILHWVEQFDSYLDRYYDSERIHETGCYKKINPKTFHSKYPPYIQRDIDGLHNTTKPNFEFTPSEIAYGNKKLKKLGIKLEKKIVCIYARDSEYLKNTYPKIDWSHHNYRDFDINLFKEAVYYLIKNNYFVIRVGSVTNKKLEIESDNFLDYSFSGEVSDFLDLYLPFKCSFFISTSSGIDGFPGIFRKPILWPSLFPLKDIKSSKIDHMASFRHLKFKESGRKLTMKEVINLNLDYCYDTKDLEKKNVALCEPTPEEIKAATKDMVEFLENKYINNSEIISNNKKFTEPFKNSKMMFKETVPYHNPNEINFTVSKSFLENNSWWLK